MPRPSHSTRRRAVLLARLLAVAAIPLVAGACPDERGPMQVREGAFVWNGVVASGNTVRVRELQGAIEVGPSADDTVRVTARIEWRRGDPDEGLSFSGVTQDGDLLICAVWTGGNCSKEAYNANIRVGRSGRDRTDAKVYFAIQVPAGVRLDLVNINGDIKVAASAPVLARTVNGDVIVATAVGPVDAETLNGSVDVRMASLGDSGQVRAETMNGSAYIYLPDNVDAVVDLSVTNGSVSSEFAIPVQGEPSRRHLRGPLGTGTRPVNGKTMNGEVALRRLPQAASGQQP